jgi:predicted outer membrane repeat protein
MQSAPTLINCTFVGNYSPEHGGAIFFHHGAMLTLENCIIAFNGYGEAVYWGIFGRGQVQSQNSEVTFTSCSIYGNDEGDWVGHIENQYGINGNMREDPLFCDPHNGTFRLRENSPCAPFSPPNAEYDLVGAWPVGCELSGLHEE